MSLSPFKSSARQLSTRPKSAPLSLLQALLITAGLAGLVGLSSGIIIRFSLSHSPNARFLSPLQTFPALPNWTPELPQGTADSHYMPGGSDTTADGAEIEGIGTQSDHSYPEPGSSDTTTSDAFAEQNQNSDPYTAPFAEEEASTYSEEPYVEEPYVEEPYPEEPYVEEPYPEDDYYYYPENYPAVEAPADGESPY